jgi:long-chain acyl-CoA synthetase
MGLRDITIQDIITKNAILRGDEVGFICENGRFTFSHYAREVQQLASGLAFHGIHKGDRIGVVAFNCYEYFLLYGAAAMLGAIMLPINWRLKKSEIQSILVDCTPKVIAGSSDFTEILEGLANSCPFVELWLAIGERIQGFHDIHEVAGVAKEFQQVEVTQEDPFVIILTAATEGKPRAAVLTHGNLVMANLQIMAFWGNLADEVYLHLLPLFHIGALTLGFSLMHAGGRNVIMRRFNAQEGVNWIERERVSIIATFSPMLSMLLDQAEASGQSLSTLRVVSAFDDADTISRCQRMTGAKIWSSFGQTETTGFCTICQFHQQPGSAGKEGPLMRVRVVDEYDREVPVGHAGEIVVRGPMVFKGYWKQEKETAYSFRQNWHHTGDIGRFDDKGYLWYIKRKAEKELIKPGGENVYPAEVERALLNHPDILEACVFGVPDNQWGEAIKAVCVRKEGSHLGAQALIDFVASRIARFKKPKYVVFSKSLPKNCDGNVDREKVKADYKSIDV